MTRLHRGRVLMVTAAVLILSAAALGFYSLIVQEPDKASADVKAVPMVNTDISDYQQSPLSDGVVTEEEVRQAIGEAADCIDAAGIEAIRPGDARMGEQLSLGWVAGSGPDAGARSAAAKECERRYSQAVRQAFVAQRAGPVVSQAEREAATLRCLTQNGVAAPEHLSPAEVERLMKADTIRDIFVACANSPAR